MANVQGEVISKDDYLLLIHVLPHHRNLGPPAWGRLSHPEQEKNGLETTEVVICMELFIVPLCKSWFFKRKMSTTHH